MKTILLNPGPVNVSAHVRQALNGPDLCHREPEFYDLQDAIRSRLLDAFGVADQYTPVLLTGSGTAMVEAMIASGVEENGRPGAAAERCVWPRMVRITRAHRICCDVIECPLTERHDLERVDTRLRGDRYHALAVVHHGATAGL
jgi:2-aminoethylphosphonate-pyruvate transaminase